MDFIRKNKVTIIALVIVACGVIAYLMFFRGDTTQNANTALVTFESSEALATNQQFLALFTELQEIDFDTSVFTNPYFLGLQNYTQPITPVARGRDNPFAPF